ncbi:tigger transposable element-derived protein 1 [Caerostris darwini]|uniref:Tigger transposable element-derived protein 1 n=1 Tax=Caerostris darwini TaxID=1538125 RepID=A0AAV4T7U5_9ARAC|nr:tigger transposable element-derived protein 1 [Caerostris darwini]
MKDRLTLALCANASGDCKIKPLLVYHSENPRAFKSHKILKEKLQVMWRSNPKHGSPGSSFVEWAWLGVTTKTLTSAWKKLWPEAVAERIYEELEPGVSVEEDIVSLGKSMGLEVEERDVNELIEEYTQELTTEEMQELQSQQHTEVMQEIGFEESEEEVISTIDAGDALSHLKDSEMFDVIRVSSSRFLQSAKMLKNHPKLILLGKTDSTRNVHHILTNSRGHEPSHYCLKKCSWGFLLSEILQIVSSW